MARIQKFNTCGSRLIRMGTIQFLPSPLKSHADLSRIICTNKFKYFLPGVTFLNLAEVLVRRIDPTIGRLSLGPKTESSWGIFAENWILHDFAKDNANRIRLTPYDPRCFFLFAKFCETNALISSGNSVLSRIDGFFTLNRYTVFSLGLWLIYKCFFNVDTSWGRLLGASAIERKRDGPTTTLQVLHNLMVAPGLFSHKKTRKIFSFLVWTTETEWRR